MNLTAALLAFVIAAPAGASLIALASGSRAVTRHAGVVGGVLGAIASAALAIGAIVAAAPTTIRIGGADQVWIGVTADHLTVVLLVLVSFVNAVVQIFARRQLLGDAAGGRFVVRTGFLISATAVMVSSSSVITLAAGWTLAGIALIALVAMYWPQPAARDAARHTTRMVIIGDGSLWAAIGLYTATGGSQDMAALAPGPDAGPITGTIIGILLVVAAAARCSQMPFHRWLSASLAAPTPVSAILHAGVVNAGGILLVRMYPVVGVSAWAMGLAFAIAAVGTVVATLVMLARPDIKGALVYSTIAQMAFLLLACSLGLLAAAISHLVAHGMFKSTLFLGSTSTVGAHIRHEDETALARLGRPRAVGLAALTLLIASVSVAALALVLRPDSHASGVVLMAFAAVTAASAGWGWIRRRPTGSGIVVLTVAIPVMAAGYLAILTALTHFFSPVLAPVTAAAMPAWAFAALLVALLIAWYVPAHTRRWARLHAWLYVHVLAAGQPIAATARSITAPALMPTHHHLPTPVPVTATHSPVPALPVPEGAGL